MFSRLLWVFRSSTRIDLLNKEMWWLVTKKKSQIDLLFLLFLSFFLCSKHLLFALSFLYWCRPCGLRLYVKRKNGNMKKKEKDEWRVPVITSYRTHILNNLHGLVNRNHKKTKSCILLTWSSWFINM